MLSSYLLRMRLRLPARFSGACAIHGVGHVQAQDAALERAAGARQVRIFCLNRVDARCRLLGRCLIFVGSLAGRGAVARARLRLNFSGTGHPRTSTGKGGNVPEGALLNGLDASKGGGAELRDSKNPRVLSGAGTCGVTKSGAWGYCATTVFG